MQEDSRYSKTSLSILQYKQRCNKFIQDWMAGSFVLFGSVYINYAVLQIERKKNYSTNSIMSWGIFIIAIKMANDNAQN